MDTVDTQANRSIAESFYRRFDANDIPGVLDLMADDISFWIAGKPGSSPAAGAHTKEQMAEMFRRITSRLKGPLHMKIKQVTAEGDRVALEVESYGELLNGRVYNNEYHALLTIRDGKVAAVREYMDTQHVHDVWYRA
jgi:uncharacterized protein